MDHIRPVAGGGTNDVLNLVTSCADCNSGKSDKALDDRSAIVRQRDQLAKLAERREQLEMMLQWRDDAEREKLDAVQAVCDRIAERAVFEPNESGKQTVRRWLKRFGLDEVLGAADDAFDQHLEWRGDEPTTRSWELAFKKVPAFVQYRREAITRPYLQRLAYIQGIFRRRFADPEFRCIAGMEEWLVAEGQPLPQDQALALIEALAKRSDNWDHFIELVISATAAHDALAQQGGSDGTH